MEPTKEISEEFEQFLKDARQLAHTNFIECDDHTMRMYWLARRETILEIMIWLKEH